MCVVFFYSWKPPYYSPRAPLSFPCYSWSWPRAEHKLPLLPALGETEWCQAESQGLYMRFHLNVELFLLPNEKGAKSSRVKSCLQGEWKEGPGGLKEDMPQDEVNRMETWGQFFPWLFQKSCIRSKLFFLHWGCPDYCGTDTSDHHHTFAEREPTERLNLHNSLVNRVQSSPVYTRGDRADWDKEICTSSVS